MLQNARKTLGFKKNMVYKIPPGGGGGKPYPASGLIDITWKNLNQHQYRVWADFIRVIFSNLKRSAVF